LLFEREALADTVVRFKSQNFNPEEIKKYADKFNTQRFREEMANFIRSQVDKQKNTQREYRF
jgi:hypothetical protein